MSTLNRWKKAGLIRLAICALVTLVAQRTEARWHLDIQTGAFIPATDIEFQRGSIAVDSDIGNGGAFAIGGGYGLGKWVDLTAQTQYATNFNLFDDDVVVYSFTAGARVFPLATTAYRVRPWLGGQLGWYRVDGDFDGHKEETDDTRALIIFDPDDRVSRTDDTVGINFGGGIDVPINQRVSLGIDVRYHNAIDAFDEFEFVTTMLNVSIWFGDELAASADLRP